MNDCDDIIDGFNDLADEQITLALGARAFEVAGMHIDLALFGGEQARYVEELCDNG